ncbi:hypothetical protein [Pseudarthrobacter cellobiosi]|uniref:hypothetical protein n=1 Tax=Pseudarthrobacter cellobiosi TaxID=2953654 RepID=UPI00208F720E|nr:hypothetical protein [Pseudarthrobacter sp. HLT1-5]MCO4256515.1 hypothetical protein [Pseudarthrobacter sp. HLT1-5]
MAGIAYAVPAPSAPVPAALWVKTGMTWTGHDGTVWDLTDPNGGVCLLRDGVEGLHHPKFTQWVRKGPAVPGQVFTGAIAEERNVVLPLAVFEDASSKAWIEHDRRFWKSMHPRRQGTLTVSPGGTGAKRSIKLRYIPEDHAYDTDPATRRWAAYVALLVADQPFWTGTTVRAAWGAGGAQEFYETVGPQLVNIMTGHTMANAAVSNDGDEDAWPVWTVIGPSTAAHAGVGADVVEVPFVVAAGKAVVIDTDPRVRTALECDYTPATGNTPALFTNPVDRTADLTGAVNWARIPAGQTSPVNISITGGGAMLVELTPLYWRAW